MTKEDISVARAEMARATERRAVRKRMFGDWFTVAVLLFVLKIAGAFASGWNTWWDMLAVLAGYITGDILYLWFKTLFRRR